MNWFGWAILSAGFAGLTAVLARAGVKDVEANLATAIRTTVVFFLVWGVAAARGIDAATSISGRSWLFLTLSGLATGASWLCYFRALHMGTVAQVAPVDKLSIVVAVALAFLFLGEPLTWRHWVGGALVLAGALVLSRS